MVDEAASSDQRQVEVPSSLLVQSIEEAFGRADLAPVELGIKELPIGGPLSGVERIIIIRIISPNPLRARVTHQSFTVPIGNTESDNLAFIKRKVRNNRDPEIRGPYKKIGIPKTTRFDMDVSEQASPCLLVFHCETNRSSFLYPELVPPVEGDYAPIALLGDAKNSSDILDQAKYAFVKNGAARTVVSFCKPDPTRSLFKYGIGLRILERGNSGSGAGIITDVIIDPKVRNDG